MTEQPPGRPSVEYSMETEEEEAKKTRKTGAAVACVVTKMVDLDGPLWEARRSAGP